MTITHLSPLDTSFLEIESDVAHMHVGWVSTYAAPESGSAPSFEQFRHHIAKRLARAPRYRQRLKQVPLGLATPSWVDDPDFDLDNHVRQVAGDLAEVASSVLSEPLSHDRPLWEMVFVKGLPGGGIGVIGKAHHCMVDGVAAVELASLLLDAEPDPEEPPADVWTPREPPAGLGFSVRRVREGLAGAAVKPLEVLDRLTPPAAERLPAELAALARAGWDTVRPAPGTETLSGDLSPARRLGIASRPLAELQAAARGLDVTLNDLFLAAVAATMRRCLLENGEPPARLKTMVPANVRGAGENGGPGNRISFMFVDLPCDEDDAELRLRKISEATGARKRSGLPAAGERILDAIGQLPGPARGPISRFVSGSRFFNLTVSNIPGPTEPVYMCGCRLECAYPVIPLAQDHAVSVGMTSIAESACFGIYADPASIPDVESLAAELSEEIDRLVELASA